MRRYLKNWKVMLWLFLIVASILLIVTNGIKFGIDFKGGTLFQIHLAEKVKDPKVVESIVATIERRLDWTGLKDVKVSAWGAAEGVEFIIAQIAETDPKEVEKIENLLLKQGKFEVMLDGNIMFVGEDILQIHKEIAKGYNYRRISSQLYEWTLPFTLTEEGARKFTKAAFHKCRPIGYGEKGMEYECKRTYFFIDRPQNSIIIMPYSLYEKDKQLLLQGLDAYGIPPNTSIGELKLNIGIPLIFIDENFSSKLKEYIGKYKSAIIPANIEDDIKKELIKKGFKIKEYKVEENVPWLWKVSGAKSVISLSEEVTNNKPYVEKFEDAKIFSNLVIRGYATNAKDAKRELENITIILESGSLPVAVENISNEIISPLLGREFLFYAGLIGLFALITVAIIIFIRYKIVKLVVPILVVALSEALLVLGFASAISWNLDLASVTGILAAIGTGVDDQIIITDELTRGKKEVIKLSLLQRIKNAFFIIFAAAATTIATMSPLIVFGFGMGKLVGFAITTIVGVLIGVLITRPAYSEIIKQILE